MYTEAINTLSDQAAAKLDGQRRCLVSHFVRSMLAGMYVGAAIVLIFTIGGLLSQGSPGVVRLAMGVCFGGALTIVVFAGSELFTGSNLVLTLGVLKRKATVGDLASNWFWTYLGNLAGSVLLAFMVFLILNFSFIDLVRRKRGLVGASEVSGAGGEVLEPGVDHRPVAGPPPVPPSARTAVTVGYAWTTAQDRALRDAAEAGIEMEDVVEQLELPVDAVRARLVQLGLELTS